MYTGLENCKNCRRRSLEIARIAKEEMLFAIELSVNSPCVSPPISSAFAPYPLFQWYPQSQEILLNLGMKCCNSAFNAQGSRVILVVVQVGAVKIYVAAVQALRKNETQDETQFYDQNWWKN
jgi:hypothetical protein